ncbi:hypothetical protein [Clostridium sp. BL-8]|uniref:hypothetical protein n=1 Tax=Clostridium sp. BL-8 TaxID=349938 RepID=UPI00098C39CA|nr:hypothetical protein [Clostridium sp. BL-8]
MRYIGPFFRMNSLSQQEISGQLFHLSKESIKTLVLNSKCGLLAQLRTSKKSSIDDISILNNFSPLLCIYRKASPVFIHSKSSHGFDESSFKKEINPSTNAFMTLSLLELSEYYSHFNDGKRNISSLEKPFRYLAKEQLQFYSENLRNNEGLFVSKKNMSDGNSKGFSLVDKDDKFKFADQAFMMDSYLLYSNYNKSDNDSEEYSKFSHEILDMFKDYKTVLYDLSFNEGVEIFLALNIFYKYSSDDDARKLILDLGDFLISKFQDKDYYSDSIDNCALFAICLMEAYKHTEIISFKDAAKEIVDKLINLYDIDKNIFVKLSDKKDSKYSCLEVAFYLLCLIMYSLQEDKSTELRPIISGIYRKFFVNGGLLTSWPEAPTLDEVERYRRLSLHSADMLDETYFRMPVLPTPKSAGLASIFVKSLDYSKRKDSLSSKKTSLDSNRNMFIFFLIIYLFKDMVEDFMEFNLPIDSEKTPESLNISKPQSTCHNYSLVKNSVSDNINKKSYLDDDNIYYSTINAQFAKECINSDESKPKNLLSSKKISNIPTLSKDNIKNVKFSPPPTSKKNKKNKTHHPKKKKH